MKAISNSFSDRGRKRFEEFHGKDFTFWLNTGNFILLTMPHQARKDLRHLSMLSQTLIYLSVTQEYIDTISK